MPLPGQTFNLSKSWVYYGDPGGQKHMTFQKTQQYKLLLVFPEMFVIVKPATDKHLLPNERH